jgi:hypothetical protein
LSVQGDRIHNGASGEAARPERGQCAQWCLSGHNFSTPDAVMISTVRLVMNSAPAFRQA